MASENDTHLTHQGWTITARKRPILKAGPIEEMTTQLGIQPPEMIFGDNLVELAHAGSGFRIAFTAFDALDQVDKTAASMLQVAHSAEWQRNRQHYTEDIKEVVKPFDWSYTTPYRGTFAQNDESAVTFQSDPTAGIPLDKLKMPDPILFFADVPLYEDELADNGISLLSVKVRVMPARLLLLARFFLRLDGVLFRIRDTRVYVEFATGEVLREWTAKESDFAAVQKRVMQRGGADATAALRDPNAVVQFLPEKERVMEKLVVSPQQTSRPQPPTQVPTQ